MQGADFCGSGLWNDTFFGHESEPAVVYSIWEYGIDDKKWNNVTSAVDMKAYFIRAIGGASVSVPCLILSFYIGLGSPLDFA